MAGALVQSTSFPSSVAGERIAPPSRSGKGRTSRRTVKMMCTVHNVPSRVRDFSGLRGANAWDMIGKSGQSFHSRVAASTSAKRVLELSLEEARQLDVEVPSSEYEDFSVRSENLGNKLKISVEVFGARTQETYDAVFSKMVVAAQPIPGFRRVKGGKTPDIPRDILLEVLGPSKVYKEVIKKSIDSAITEYVKKERLTVGKNVSVEQSFEDLEARFEPGQSFQFDAIIQCQQSN